MRKNFKMVLTSIVLVLALGYTNAVTREEVFDQVTSSSYDMNQPPPPADEPTYVQVGIYVNSLAMDRQKETLTWTIYIRESWNDTRVTSLFGSEDKKVTMGQGQWKKFWYPDLFFRNSLEVVHDDRPAEQTLLNVEQKQLWLVHKFRLTTSCYGLHRIGQVKRCSLMIESFKYTMDDLVLTWLSTPLDLDPGITLPGYILEGSNLNNCSQNYTAGAFPCAEIQLLLQDNSHTLVMSAPRLCFAISIFLVIASWLSFWIDGDKILERLALLLGLGISLILLIVALNVTDELDLPDSSIVIFIAGCIIFVVAAILEYVVAYGVLQWIPSKVKAIRKGGAEESSSFGRVSRIIDIVCGLVVFPVLFAIFLFFFLSTDI